MISGKVSFRDKELSLNKGVSDLFKLRKPFVLIRFLPL